MITSSLLLLPHLLVSADIPGKPLKILWLEYICRLRSWGRKSCCKSKNEAYSKILPLAAFAKLQRADFKDRLSSTTNLPVVKDNIYSSFLHISIKCREFLFHYPGEKGELPDSLHSRKGRVTRLMCKPLPVCISLVLAKSWAFWGKLQRKLKLSISASDLNRQVHLI